MDGVDGTCDLLMWTEGEVFGREICRRKRC